MTIEELENKHSELIEVGLGNTEEELAEYYFNNQTQHKNVSIQFAISVLEEVNKNYPEIIHYRINDKIQELKQYLDDNN